MNTELKIAAKVESLTTIEITYGMNGYPEGLGDNGVIGFRTFEDAEKFAEDWKGEIVHFHSRDGWHFWEANGRAWSPYSAHDYLSDLGDDYNIEDDTEDNIKAKLESLIENYDGDLLDLIGKMGKLMELLKAVYYNYTGLNQYVISRNGEYCESIENAMMFYNHDTHKYAIGVLFTAK